MREAVSISLVSALLAEGADVVVYDPAALQNARSMFKETVSYAKDPYECFYQADCCIIVAEWGEFRSITPSQFHERMRCPVVIDGRRIYDAEKFSRAGMQFLAIGLGPTNR